MSDKPIIPSHLTRVRLLRNNGSGAAAGMVGTIVHRYPGGEAYEVEFTWPTNPPETSVEAIRRADLEVVDV